MNYENKSERYPFTFILVGDIGNAIDRILVLYHDNNYNFVNSN